MTGGYAAMGARELTDEREYWPVRADEDLWVAFRETHRRRGVGSALGSTAAAFLYTKEHPARFNHWGLDVAAGP